MPDTDPDPFAPLRDLVESLPDGVIRGALDAFMRGILHGLADEFTDRLVEMICDQIADEEPANGGGVDLTEHRPTPRPDRYPITEQFESVNLDKPDNRPRPQDARVHTCELCGRVGSRRFVETSTGWKCSPTASCGGRNPVAPKPSDIPAKQFPADVTPAPTPKVMPPRVSVKRSSSEGQPITAYCEDCPKTYTLTGNELRRMVDIHELKGHIVVIDGADA